jgi:hypothetical protein
MDKILKAYNVIIYKFKTIKIFTIIILLFTVLCLCMGYFAYKDINYKQLPCTLARMSVELDSCAITHYVKFSTDEELNFIRKLKLIVIDA